MRRTKKTVKTKKQLRNEKLAKWLATAPKEQTDAWRERYRLSRKRRNRNRHLRRMEEDPAYKFQYLQEKRRRDRQKAIQTLTPEQQQFLDSIRNQSYGAREIELYLLENKHTYNKEQKFDGMVSPDSKWPLSIDFYLPELYIAIEFDGEQHYKFPNKYHLTEECFKKQWRNDREKDFFCMTKGIKMVRIRYDQMKQIISILDEEII